MTIRSCAPLLAVLVSVCLASEGPAIADDGAAHALAEKFADGAEKEEAKRRAAEAKRKTDEAKRRVAAEEAEMLERARVEAAERKAAADKARAEEEAADARREEGERVEKARLLAEQQRIAREKFIAEKLRIEEEQRLAEEKRHAEEERLAAERRAEEERRIADEQRAAEERRIAEEKKRADEEHRLAEEKRRAEDERIAAEKRAEEERRVAEEKRAAEENQKRLAAEREAEHVKLTQRLLRMEQERNARKALTEKEPKEPMGLGAKSPDTSPDAAPRATAPAVASSAPPTTRVTVLLVMEPGTNGIRRYGKKTADPVLCSGQTCWVSTGADSSATVMTRGQALGPANTLGRRAADCNQHLACTFRELDLKAASASVQPIDLRVMRHDRRQPLALEADPTCRLSGSVLVCDRVFATGTWRAWVVPEALAAKAGPETLEAALAGGLAIKPSAALRTPL
jgi:colicin import membrane protein